MEVLRHCVHILAGHNGFVQCLCSVGDVLFTGSQDCNIMIWDLNNLQDPQVGGGLGVVKGLWHSDAFFLMASRWWILASFLLFRFPGTRF